MSAKRLAELSGRLPADGQPSMKMGYHFRGATEHVLFAVKGKLRLRAQRALPTAYLWPRLPHSVKPEPFYALVEEASQPPYLELFARKNRLGWDAWGNQCISINLEAAMKLPVHVEGDTTIVDADGAFVAECHQPDSAVGTQEEYDNAQQLADSINGNTR